MSAALILDTETTGTDAPDVIELAHMGPLASPLADAPVTLLNFKPSKPITLGALATHHIIEDDLTDFQLWSVDAFTLPAGADYLVGHNIDFDWKAIGSPPKIKRICTLALARRIWPTIDSHRLEALIYYIYPHGLARSLVKVAHNAAADVGLCHRILGVIWDSVGRPETWEQFWQISEKARIPERIGFGKYGPKDGQPGMLISEMRRMDPGYVQWLLNNADQVKNDPYLQKALRGA
jgi:exodeoxyribonuclease X